MPKRMPKRMPLPLENIIRRACEVDLEKTKNDLLELRHSKRLEYPIGSGTPPSLFYQYLLDIVRDAHLESSKS